MIKLCVLAHTGRMGKQVAALAKNSPDIRLVSAFSRRTAIAQAELSPEVFLSDDLDEALARADVYIDFSTPQLSALAATKALEHGCAAVVGTTGLDGAARQALTALSDKIPVFVAANFSPGVALLLHLAQEAARALGPEYDLEVVEMHHRNKVDSPSGTALALGESLAKGRGIDFEDSKCSSRDGNVGPRKKNEIGIMALRGGDIVGEHTAYLVGNEERIEITHRAQSRTVFASGALRCARWLTNQSPGHYGMRELLGI